MKNIYDKEQAAITEIKVREKSYKDNPQTVHPTYVNFFFGKNGAGKSSVAEAMKDPRNLTVKETGALAKHKLCIFDQDFINTHTDYDRVKGVFTLGEIKVEILAKIKANEDKIEKLSAESGELAEQKEKKETERDGLKPALQAECLKLTSTLRTKFKDALSGWSKNPRLTEELLAVRTPTDHDTDDLKKLCDTVFQSDGKTYASFTMPADTDMTSLAGYGLLAKIITSSSDTPYATFIKNLNAGDWIKEGHDKYSEDAEGHCPYCGKKLDDDFEEKFKACFDKEYEEDTAGLITLYDDYKRKTESVVYVLENNLTDAYPKLKSLAAYKAKVAQLKTTFQTNLKSIERKKSSPSTAVTLDDTDTVIGEIGDLIAEFNKEIKEYNDAVASPDKKDDCIKQVKEKFAFAVQTQLDEYRDALNKVKGEIKDLKDKQDKLKGEISDLQDEITAWRNTSGGTEEAVENINRHLLNSGFQSFHLEKKPGEKDVYYVKRYDGTVVKELSEGEENFIAFLFFNELVHGKESQSDELINKIVVIDDPVSSMDSNSLFIVGALVRTMISICLNNVSGFEGDEVKDQHIKQIFILTHNAFFHNEITYNRTGDYDHVAFFSIDKKTTQSVITLKRKEKKGTPTQEWINVNPVQTSYKALWEEYKEVDSPIPLMSVMRRILEYYFIQLGGYEGDDLEKRIFSEKNVKDYFEDELPNGTKDSIRKEIAEAAIRHIVSGTYGFNDGKDYVVDCSDIEACKRAFEGIFRSMDQGQHYDKMMEN